jgi:D-amino-acid oxidase
MKRRHAISLTLGGLIGTSGCRRPPPGETAAPADIPDEEEPEPTEAETAPPPAPEGISLTPVTVDPALRIRTLTGLRPFRPSGFILRREDLDGKTLVHNYGHGGGGISLSWGCAEMAIRLARPLAGARCAVIGGGVMGLSTARLLQLQGAEVTLYTRDLTPGTTSDIAGGQCWPVAVFDANRRTPEFSAQYVEAAEFSNRYFQKLVGSRWGIRWVPNYYLSRNPPANGWMGGPGGVLHHLQVAFRDFGPGEHVFPSPYVRRFHTLMIEPPVYLRTLLRDIQSAGGRVTIREFSDANEVLQLPETLLFNCSGLGARQLFGDEELIPVRGQLEVLMPQSEVDYNLITDSFYMFPRTDGIILGGTFERGIHDLTPNAATRENLLAGNRRVFDGMRDIQASFR